MPVDRESCDLLLAVARRPSGMPAKQIEQLAARVRDWDSLLRTAQEHRVLPLLYLRLEAIGQGAPEAAQDRLRAAYQRNVFHSLANAAELIAVLKALDQESIPAMPFKGVVLGASIYGDLSTRPAGDLDVLIQRKDLVAATAVLTRRGYELKTDVDANGMPNASNSYEYHFERRSDGMVIELRWRLELTQPRFRHVLGMDWVWPQRRVATLAGAEVPDIRPEILLLILCMHGSKHIWSRLIWICDVAQLIAITPDLQWNEVIWEAKRSGLWRALALGVLLAHRVAGVAVPESVLRRFEADTTARKLALFIGENLFDAPGSTPASRVPYALQLLGPHDRMMMFLSLNFLRPNERDRAVVRLPRTLHALYYVIRPFRILWDKSAR